MEADPLTPAIGGEKSSEAQFCLLPPQPTCRLTDVGRLVATGDVYDAVAVPVLVQVWANLLPPPLLLIHTPTTGSLLAQVTFPLMVGCAADATDACPRTSAGATTNIPAVSAILTFKLSPRPEFNYGYW
jgi:hypothetical protein